MEYRQFTTNESVALDQARAAISNNNIYSAAYKREALANLDALACAEIRCGAGVSENDPHYATLNTLQAKGEQLQKTQQTDIYATLKELGVASTEEKTVRRGRDQFAHQKLLFGYGALDASDDFIGSNEQISARVQQVAVGAGGSAEAALGVAVTTAGCATLAPCVVAGPVGAWLAADGADTAHTASEALNSDYVYVNGTRVLNSFIEATHQESVSPTAALLTNVGVNVAGGVIAKKAGALVLRDELPAVGVVPNSNLVGLEAKIANRTATRAEWAQYSQQIRSSGQTFDNILKTDGDFLEGFAYREWPPNAGFLGDSSRLTLEPGAVIDRFGGNRGTYVSPDGTGYRARALKPGTDRSPFRSFEVLKPLDVDAGLVKPWFGYEGLGTQYKLPQSVIDLMDSDHLRRIDNYEN